MIIKALIAGMRARVKPQELLLPGSPAVPEVTAFRIRMETRTEDWEKGGLDTAYFLATLQTMAATLDKIIGSPKSAKYVTIPEKKAKASVREPEPQPQPVSELQPQPVPEPERERDAAAPSTQVLAAASAHVHPSRLALVARPPATFTSASVKASDKPKRHSVRVTADEDNMEDSDDMEWESTADAAQSSPVIAPATPTPVVKKKKRKKKSKPLGGHMGNLLQKWKAVKDENDKEARKGQLALEAKLDPVMAKKQQALEIAKWKKETIQSGFAEDNPNFEPIAGDWRARVARKKKALAKR